LKRVCTSSILVAVSLVFPYAWFFAPFGLALLLRFIRDRKVSVAQVVYAGLVFGFITSAAGTAWFLSALPLESFPTSKMWIQVTAVVMTWGYVAASLAVPVPLGAVALKYVRSDLLFPFAAGIVWTLVELGRMWGFAITTYGRQSLFGPHFSAAALGYTLTEHSTLLQLAHPWGLDALNFSVAFGAGLITIASYRRVSRPTVVALASQLVVFCGVWHISSQSRAIIVSLNDTSKLRFALVSENIERAEVKGFNSGIQEGLLSAVRSQPTVDVVVLPENIGLSRLFPSKQEYLSFIEREVGARDILIVNFRHDLFSADDWNSPVLPSALAYDSTLNGELGRLRKHMLVPIGEYAPSFTKTFFSIIPDPMLQAYVRFIDAKDSERASVPSRTLSVGEFRGVRVGGLICSDIVSPYLYHKLVREHGAQVLINVASHAWFHGSQVLYWKNLQMARLHAVQNRVPMLVANNTSPSFAVDSLGNLIAATSAKTPGVVYVDLLIRKRTGSAPSI
jgi:apolipoprotein N-acyltransferase